MFKVFNPSGTDEKSQRQFFGGNSTGIINLNNVKYQWCIDLWRQMREQYWVAEKFDLSCDTIDYNHLTSEEQRAFDGILAYLVFLDSVQVQNIPHIVQNCTAPELSLCFGEQLSQECFDKETELLTSTGWKNVSLITKEDKLAQYNIDSTAITFANPIKLHKYFYEGDLVLFESKNTSICVTPNHDLIKIHPVTKKAQKVKAGTVLGGNYLYPKTGIFLGSVDSTLSDLERLLIAVAADGTIRIMKNGNRYVQIGISKIRKIVRLENLLEQLDIPYHKKIQQNGCFRYGFHLPQVFNEIELTHESIKSFDFIDNLPSVSPNTARKMIEEICFWDGNMTRKTNYFFYSTNKQAIDKTQIIAMIAGFSAQVGINRTEEEAKSIKMPSNFLCPKTAKTCYVLSIAKNFQTKTYPNPQKQLYNDFVYCVSVPEENVVSRKRGIVAITGNSLHAQSYAYMIESILPVDKKKSIYTYWKDDKVLLERCEIIGSYYQNYIDNPSEETFLISLIADYILEALYFYCGFAFFYNLASRSLMGGSADIFRLINRDELSHVRLYQKILAELLKTPLGKEKGFQYLEEIMKEAVQQEIKWSEHIIGDQILGFSPQSIQNYIYYLANLRLKAVGATAIFPKTENPFKHLEKTADTSSEGNVKANFFDCGVTSYQMASAVGGWDDF